MMLPSVHHIWQGRWGSLRTQLPLRRLLRYVQVEVKVPSMGESITEGTIQSWKRMPGDKIEADDLIAIIDTDKISVDVNSPVKGFLVKAHAGEGDTVNVGDALCIVDTDLSKDHEGASTNCSAGVEKTSLRGDQGSIRQTTTETKAEINPESAAAGGFRHEKKVPMSRMRQRIANRLKEAQSEGVLLTTFQECDMSAVMTLRKKIGKDFLDRFGVKLGFNSFFLKACSDGLQKWPGINAAIEGNNILERNFVDISVAVATPTGLMVPVIRDVHRKTLGELETSLAAVAQKARDGKLTMEEISGGTFTISNGGVYGSMMGTPIINPPQSAILGMHGIQDRPVVRDGKIVIRPIMYLALTYDHRIVDGREAVSFLKDVAAAVETPESLLAETL